MSSPAANNPQGTPANPAGMSSSPVRYGNSPLSSSPRSGSSHVPRTPTSSTPMAAHARSDIGYRTRAGFNFHEPNATAESDEKVLTSTDASDMGTKLVWGTTIDIRSTMKRFRTFFERFKDDSGQAKYMLLLDEIIQCDVYNINLDCSNLHTFDHQLYMELTRYPSELIPIFDFVIHEIIQQKYPSVERKSRTQVRTFNLREVYNMRSLNPDDIDKLVSIKGMVIRCSQIIPDLKMAFFRCSICNTTEEVMIDRGRINEPSSCRQCQTKNSMAVIHNRCLFADKQLIRVQETPDTVPEGETPHTVTVFSYDDLVDVAKPGDRVVITGIFKARPIRANPRRRNINSIFHTYLDAIHFQKTEKDRIGAEDAHSDRNSEFFTSFEESDIVSNIAEEKKREFHRLASDPNIYDKLMRSIAPSVYQMEDVKRGILCQLFGGSNKDLGGGRGRFRGEINILLCGDPGVSKSQLLQYVHKIAPRGIYTSGKGSSAVGLTAYISKDPDTKELVLESGALVLSDRGVCCIDEFDKMTDSTRSILHEVMEQQTVSIAKAGIVCTLNARTSILASANPKDSRYDPTKSVVENIQLMPTLLSRFDLIYLVLDQPNDMADRKLAKHLVSLYYEHRPAANDDFIPKETLTQYISYARSHVNPVISDEAVDDLVSGYVEMRKIGQHASRKVVTATPRQLESLIRLSEALARMRLCPKVEPQDVKEARRLMTVATQTAATDPTTGLIDMDLITTGVSARDRKRVSEQSEAIKSLLGSDEATPIKTLLTKFNEQSDVKLALGEMREVLEQLQDEGFLRFAGRDKVARV